MRRACSSVSANYAGEGAIPNFATEKEPKRNFLYLADVTLVVVDIKSERFIKKDKFTPRLV